MRRIALFVAIAFIAGCANAPLSPATLDTRNDTCASCRMPVSDARLAAQLVRPHEEPLFFDDLGCLHEWLHVNTAPPKGARVFVADHRTKEWVPLSVAVLTHVKAFQTPMGSHLLAHASEASRAQDPAAAGGEVVVAATLFGPVLDVETARR